MNETQVTMVGFVASKPSLVLTKAGRFVANGPTVTLRM
jgi:hypothetical protein